MIWPQLIKEIPRQPHLDVTPHETVADTWNDVQYIDWVMALGFTRIRLTKDDKYIIGTTKSGHDKYVARLYDPERMGTFS